VVRLQAAEGRDPRRPCRRASAIRYSSLRSCCPEGGAEKSSRFTKTDRPRSPRASAAARMASASRRERPRVGVEAGEELGGSRDGGPWDRGASRGVSRGDDGQDGRAVERLREDAGVADVEVPDRGREVGVHVRPDAHRAARVRAAQRRREDRGRLRARATRILRQTSSACARRSRSPSVSGLRIRPSGKTPPETSSLSLTITPRTFPQRGQVSACRGS